MSHDINEYQPFATTGWRPTAVNTVLTVTDGSYARDDEGHLRTATILFRHRPDDRSRSGVVINAWTPERVDIVGEDLYALRALLAELPESAFTEPKPSTVLPDWEAGDIVRECWADGEDVLGRDVDGIWTSVKGTSSITHTDADIDHFLREGQHLGSYSYSVVRRGGVFL